MILANCRTQKVEFTFFFWNLQKSIQNDNHLPGVTGHVPRKTYFFRLVIRSLTTIFRRKKTGEATGRFVVKNHQGELGMGGYGWLGGGFKNFLCLHRSLGKFDWLRCFRWVGGSFTKKVRVGKYLEKSSARNSGCFFRGWTSVKIEALADHCDDRLKVNEKKARHEWNGRLADWLGLGTGGFKDFIFAPRSLGKWSILIDIFQMGCKHHLL